LRVVVVVVVVVCVVLPLAAWFVFDAFVLAWFVFAAFVVCVLALLAVVVFEFTVVVAVFDVVVVAVVPVLAFWTVMLALPTVRLPFVPLVLSPAAQPAHRPARASSAKRARVLRIAVPPVSLPSCLSRDVFQHNSTARAPEGYDGRAILSVKPCAESGAVYH
jgi:hypothetical protein